MSELLAELLSGLLELVLNFVCEGLWESGFIGWRFMLPVLVSIGVMLWMEIHPSSVSVRMPSPLLIVIGGGVLGFGWELVASRKRE